MNETMIEIVGMDLELRISNGKGGLRLRE